MSYFFLVFLWGFILNIEADVSTKKEEILSSSEIPVSSSSSNDYSSSSSSSSVSTISVKFDSTTEKPSTTTSKTKISSSTTTGTTPDPNEWIDISQEESDKLVRFIVKEIQKLKVEHKELDDCQELDLSSVLSGKKQGGNPIKYSVTLKVQPQLKNTESCQKQNATLINMHPEICEADIIEGDRGGTLGIGKTLIRSTCLQVEELQD